MTLHDLNRRHKIGLLLVLAGAGLALILDASLKQTAGLVLIGLASTWLVASLSLRALRLTGSLLLAIGGLSIAVVPVFADWNEFQGSEKDYDAATADIRQAIGSAAIGTLPSKTKGEPATHGPWEKYAQNAPAPTSNTLPAGFFGEPLTDQFAYLSHADPDFSKATPVDQQAYVKYLRESSTITVQIPESMQRWARGGWKGEPSLNFPATMTTEEIARAFTDHGLQPRPIFSLWNTVRSHEESFFGGVATAALGLIGCAWTFRRKSPDQTHSTPLN